MIIREAISDGIELHRYVKKLWKTEIFQKSHRQMGFVHNIVDQFASMPRIFAEMTNDHLERSHFSTWWGVIMLRDTEYENPYIHDLYLLHEFYHAGHMPYIRNIGRAAFDEKMQRNELEASTLSEIQVYFEMPELRKASFGYPIYADRFLEDPEMRALWDANPVVAIETLRSIRRDVMLSKPEHLMDLTERWVRRFAEQNAVHSLTWSDRYLEVENRMFAFQQEAAKDREAALANHVAWIEAEAATDQADHIPFRREAELFSAFYWANKEKYTEAMARA